MSGRVADISTAGSNMYLCMKWSLWSEGKTSCLGEVEPACTPHSKHTGHHLEARSGQKRKGRRALEHSLHFKQVHKLSQEQCNTSGGK